MTNGNPRVSQRLPIVTSLGLTSFHLQPEDATALPPETWTCIGAIIGGATGVGKNYQTQVVGAFEGHFAIGSADQPPAVQATKLNLPRDLARQHLGATPSFPSIVGYGVWAFKPLASTALKYELREISTNPMIEKKA